MEKEERITQEDYAIDITHILSYIWKYAWAVILSTVLAALLGLLAARFIMEPVYSAEVRLYVEVHSGSDSYSNLSAARNLTKSCSTILTGRSTLELVAEKVGMDGSEWKRLKEMISCHASGDTEILQITVSCNDPYLASQIANAIGEVLPQRVSEIVKGASMKMVDSAKPDLDKVGPSVLKYTLLGGVLGGVLVVMLLIVLSIMDNTIHDEEYVVRVYNYPILGKVPDLMNTGGSSYGYYARSNKTGRGKGA